MCDRQEKGCAMDSICLEQMQFYGYHGVLPEETKLGQRFFVDLTLYLSLLDAGLSDDLSYTVNYAEVYELTREIVEHRRFKLIEALAEAIASELLCTYNDIQEIQVRVVKPNPPFPIRSNGVGVQIYRKRDRS